MRAIVQRVTQAEVEVNGEVIGRCEKGLLLLVGVHRDDVEANAEKLADRVANLRIFNDEAGKMNLAIGQIQGQVLAISNFTVWGDTTSRRPSFTASASFDQGKRLFELFVERLRQRVAHVDTGEFGAHMDVRLSNDGPVTVLVDA